ncbi:integrase catalytic domain-containing protein [Trichonephila clavipes]|nr:integrase catalytic domain-containing protein [Trichonephila clavipes]
MSNCVSNLSKFLCEERVEWSFIPPRAPNHGGLWEAGVKAVKYHLRRVMGDFDALTPGHFLVGRPITAIAEPSLTEVSDNRLKVWQKQTKIVQHIWKRWSNNYLSTLQNRNKWYFEKNNVKIHDMVILKEDNLPVCNWPLGRILEVYHVMSRRKQRSVFDQVSDFDRGRIVAYRDCVLSSREIGSRVGRKQTTVTRICDRWMQEGTTD